MGSSPQLSGTRRNPGNLIPHRQVLGLEGAYLFPAEFEDRLFPFGAIVPVDHGEAGFKFILAPSFVGYLRQDQGREPAGGGEMGMGVRLFSSVEAQDRAPGYPADLSKVGLGEEDELRGRAAAAHTLGLIEARQARKAGSEPDRPGGTPILERLLELLDHPVGPDDPRDDKNQKQDQPTDPDH